MDLKNLLQNHFFPFFKKWKNCGIPHLEYFWVKKLHFSTYSNSILWNIDRNVSPLGSIFEVFRHFLRLFFKTKNDPVFAIVFQWLECLQNASLLRSKKSKNFCVFFSQKKINFQPVFFHFFKRYFNIFNNNMLKKSSKL